jgi:hypothetical protein
MPHPSLASLASLEMASSSARHQPIDLDIEGEWKPLQELRPLTDEQCLFTVPRVKGFTLGRKEWCKCRSSFLHRLC